ncbi:MAG: TIGR00730 family Rossman fold protein [Beijerinckiaceae bacterium]|nr:TIGR00730 family Rossman fold protein [Beijerinckiaceae bacterium]MCZ8299218.1 TIGR00730 family Rossman fold protein [Beijerinckiaceae bacterium]
MQTEAPRPIRSIAVFCGSNTGLGETYIEAAKALGQAIGARGLTLVYGGTNKGLMGLLADATRAAGGHAHGVITQRLADRGHLHLDLDASEIVGSMRARKARMAELADAFIALPGGIGTLEEFMEIWTLNQLGEIDKPAGLLDVAGYYQPFLAFIDHMIGQRFLPAEHRNGIVVEPEPGRLIDGLMTFRKVTVPKWM